MKPDFQATGPRALVNNVVKLGEGEVPEDLEPDEEDIEELDELSRPATRYYESQKVLGKLYRAIDEQNFFREIQKSPRPQTHEVKERLLDRVWAFVAEQTALIQWQHYIDFAQDIKEELVFLL